RCTRIGSIRRRDTDGNREDRIEIFIPGISSAAASITHSEQGWKFWITQGGYIVVRSKAARTQTFDLIVARIPVARIGKAGLAFEQDDLRHATCSLSLTSAVSRANVAAGASPSAAPDRATASPYT